MSETVPGPLSWRARLERTLEFGVNQHLSECGEGPLSRRGPARRCRERPSPACTPSYRGWRLVPRRIRRRCIALLAKFGKINRLSSLSSMRAIVPFSARPNCSMTSYLEFFIATGVGMKQGVPQLCSLTRPVQRVSRCRHRSRNGVPYLDPLWLQKR